MHLAISDLARMYREAALITGDIGDPKAANAAADQLHRCYKQLRESEAGRSAISALMADASPHVRSWAAAHSLYWAEGEARAVLEELRDSNGRRSLSAKWTLREFDRGKLSFEY